MERLTELDPRVLRYPVIRLWEDDEETRMTFRPIPPGEFRMGSRGHSGGEEPQHLVVVPPPRESDGTSREELPPFWLGETPVTQAQLARWTESEHYRRWLAAHGKRYELEDAHRNYFDGRPKHPTESVSWWEALAFCEWLAREELPRVLAAEEVVPVGWELRGSLPAEAHWEYACRADTNTDYHSGDGEGALKDVGWFGEDWGEGSTHPVAELARNRFGLHDMHGNEWEWCLDLWDEAAYRKRLDGAEALVPQADWHSSALRVIRGGSWLDSAGWCRSAFRLGWGVGDRGNQGFRVCLLPGSVAQAAGRGAPRTERAEAPAGAGRRGGRRAGRRRLEPERAPGEDEPPPTDPARRTRSRRP